MAGLARIRVLVALAAIHILAREASALPRFSTGVAVAGVIAYQDHLNPQQFHYLPAQVPVVLGNTLQDFSVSYWGVGPRFLVQQSNGLIVSRVGAVVAGRAVLDITADQRQKLLDEIKTTYGIDHAALLPIALEAKPRDDEHGTPAVPLKVQPVFARNTLFMGEKGDFVFPSKVAFALPFNFTVGTGNSLFAAYAGKSTGDARGVVTEPGFGVNIIGNAQFHADAWTAEVDCDLSQVFSDIRKKVSVSASYYWIRLGSADYQSIVQHLDKIKDCHIKLSEGDLLNEKRGREVLEMGKRMFEEMNKHANAGDGFFKFEPNPQAAAPGGGGDGGPSWWPWSVSINGGYSEAISKQAIRYRDKITFEGTKWWEIPTSMTLAVKCGADTEALFSDLADGSHCITPEKMATLQQRLEAEIKARNKRLEPQLKRLENGEITREQFDNLLALYNTLSITEDLGSVKLAGLARAPRATGLKLTPDEKAITEWTDEELRSAEERALRGEFGIRTFDLTHLLRTMNLVAPPR